MMRMLMVGYCYGIRSERRLCEEVKLHLAYRWFCKLDLDDKVPHHSTFSVNRLGCFRDSDILRHIFERVVAACMAAGLVKGEGFAVDATVIEANASRYHGKAPDELDWSDAQRQQRAIGQDADHHRQCQHRSLDSLHGVAARLSGVRTQIEMLPEHAFAPDRALYE
jgi:hypothetical protein